MTRLRPTSHPDMSRLRQVAIGSRSDDKPTAQHARGCRSCRNAISFIRDWHDTRDDVDHCPEASDLVRYADNSGDPAVSLHLHRCLDCAVDVERLQRSSQRSTRPPVASRRRRPSLAERVRSLACFDMPLNLVLAPRAAVSAPDPVYERAMTDYQEGRYGRALGQLRRLGSPGRGIRGRDLYLGACLLDAGEYGEAARVLADAVTDRPRLGACRWYLAQALLLEGRGQEALVELDRASKMRGAYQERARESAQALRRVLEQTRGE